jgi:hypothetical protein
MRYTGKKYSEAEAKAILTEARATVQGRTQICSVGRPNRSRAMTPTAS